MEYATCNATTISNKSILHTGENGEVFTTSVEGKNIMHHIAVSVIPTLFWIDSFELLQTGSTAWPRPLFWADRTDVPEVCVSSVLQKFYQHESTSDN